MLFDYLRDAEVTDLDAVLIIKQDVVQLDVPVEHRPAMTVAQPVEDLLEDVESFLFVQPLLLLDVVEEIARPGVLHHNEEVLC